MSCEVMDMFSCRMSSSLGSSSARFALKVRLGNVRGEVVKDALELCQLCFETSPLMRRILTLLYQIRRLAAKLFDEWHALLGELDKVDKG
jgi:hypothetical protein